MKEVLFVVGKNRNVVKEIDDMNEEKETWFIVTVWDRDTNEEFEFDVTKNWLEKYGVDVADFRDVMEFIEMYWAERNCCVIDCSGEE